MSSHTRDSIVAFRLNVEQRLTRPAPCPCNFNIRQLEYSPSYRPSEWPTYSLNTTPCNGRQQDQPNDDHVYRNTRQGLPVPGQQALRNVSYTRNLDRKTIFLDIAPQNLLSNRVKNIRSIQHNRARTFIYTLSIPSGKYSSRLSLCAPH